MPTGGLYKRGEIWWARLTVDGREHRESLRTRSRPEALKRLEALRSRLVDAVHFGIERRTWEEAVVEWSTSGLAGVKPGTLKRYQSSLRMMDPHLKGWEIAAVGRKRIGEIVALRRKEGATTATIRRDLTAVSAVFETAVAAEWVEHNPVLEFLRASKRAMREKRDPIVLPDLADFAAVVARAPAMIAAMAELARATGMRLEEIASLERRQVDARRGAITLTRTKTSAPRAVPIDGATAERLAELPVHLKCRMVFWHGDGERYANLSSRWAALTAAAQKAAQKEGREFRRFRFHDLRHLAAVEMLRAGRSIYDVQKILGHASIKTTEIYLAYLTPAEQEAAKSAAAQYSAHV